MRICAKLYYSRNNYLIIYYLFNLLFILLIYYFRYITMYLSQVHYNVPIVKIPQYSWSQVHHNVPIIGATECTYGI